MMNHAFRTMLDIEEESRFQLDNPIHQKQIARDQIYNEITLPDRILEI